jgi:hypothetical protein
MYNYDEQIEVLEKNPENITAHWNCGIGLFKFLGERGQDDIKPGCITMIKGQSSPYGAFKRGVYLKELTEEIIKDERVPKGVHVSEIPLDLSIFKYYQEKYDNI